MKGLGGILKTDLECYLCALQIWSELLNIYHIIKLGICPHLRVTVWVV